MRSRPEDHLAPAPVAVRRLMLEERTALEPGAAAVVGRFFAAVARRGESIHAPSAACFAEAAASEATFRTLLRALARYAPQTSTASARDVSRAWYAQRPKPVRGAAPRSARTPEWPASWAPLCDALDHARIKESTRARYRASIDRCAAVVAEGLADASFGLLLAFQLAEAFVNHPDPKSRVRSITAANYVDALLAVGRKAGIAPVDDLDAMSVITQELRDEADAQGKLKTGRVHELMSRGGFAHVVERIADERDAAQALPHHSAARARHMQRAVLCAVLVNKPARRGDAGGWIIGRELTRAPSGDWRLEWAQEKTDRWTEAGVLWPEVSALLDMHILGGRPDRLIHLRYRELASRNWLTLTAHPARRALPSELVRQALGVPPHDLRTLAADYLRRNDPASAAGLISSHLGHGTQAAGADYRALCEGAAASRTWRRSRDSIATGAVTARGKGTRSV
ncbi:hypothetical protein [Rhodosalinus sediminis]|uniref:hypothetical protein n=1 Tax=Rhodosalinus sediminis TaxID=1940533 RepID=UPI0023564DC8|nr:hypothetical protein [Rhodosalinus sediminis]